jgi:hypothetical protein
MALARKKATAIALDPEYRDALASSQKRVGAIDVVVNAVANVLGGTLRNIRSIRYGCMWATGSTPFASAIGNISMPGRS